MSRIKLLKIGELENGIIQFQSQLYIGRQTVDFIMQDGVMKCYGRGDNGFGFYEYKEPYEIVENLCDMIHQKL